jgi:hypothetical protein
MLIRPASNKLNSPTLPTAITAQITINLHITIKISYCNIYCMGIGDLSHCIMNFQPDFSSRFNGAEVR